jgi:hypothetical protein
LAVDSVMCIDWWMREEGRNKQSCKECIA